MPHYSHILDGIAAQRDRLRQLVEDWSRINSGTFNIPGLHKLCHRLQHDFSSLGGAMCVEHLPEMISIDRRGQETRTPLGPALSIIKRPEAPLRVFLCIHMDTVYAADDSFQDVALIDADRLHGPGVCDAKGGLAVMLAALEAFETSDLAHAIGWEILINSDEEIGSPGSAGLLVAAARRNHLGLLFEPSLPDGAIVDRRRGSGHFSLVIRGRSAHAGRDFDRGRSAIVAAADLTLQLHALNQTLPGITINIGAIDGGGPANVVPDLAICRFNVRTTQSDDESRIQAEFDRILADLNHRDGISAQIHGAFSSPPKIPDARGEWLLESIISCGRDLGLAIGRRPSGGASDGNRLAAAGLPNVDSLGVRGGNIHSPDEFMIPSSLVERAQLCALLLLKLAAGDIQIPW